MGIIIKKFRRIVKKSKKIMKNPIIQIVIAILLVLLLMATAYFTVIRKPSVAKEPVEKELTANLDIVSADPKLTAAKFIEANGTMGNVEKDITQDSMKTNESTYENGTRRIITLAKIEKAVIPGNKLILGNEKDNIKKFVGNLDYPFIYKISNIEVSEPSKPEKISVYSESGVVEYQSVKVLVDFESTRIHYTWPKDVTFAGVYTQISNTEKFEDIQVVLVQSGDLWFVYDVVDSENILNERFSTWSGVAIPNIDYEKNKETGEFILENFKQVIVPEEKFKENGLDGENVDINNKDSSLDDFNVPEETVIPSDENNIPPEEYIPPREITITFKKDQIIADKYKMKIDGVLEIVQMSDLKPNVDTSQLGQTKHTIIINGNEVILNVIVKEA